MEDYFRFFYASDYQYKWLVQDGAFAGCGLIIEYCGYLITCKGTIRRERLRRTEVPEHKMYNYEKTKHIR